MIKTFYGVMFYGVMFYGVMFLAISTETVFAQENTSVILLQTNEKNYDEGDKIIISGKITTIIGQTPVTLQIFTEGNLVEIAQIEVAQDGTFSHSVMAEGIQWKKQGEYIVKALYGERNISEVVMSFTPKSKIIETTNNFEVEVENHGTYDVKYKIKGGTVENITIDSNIFGLEVEINAEDDGTITLDLPRDFIGAEKQNGKDEVFIILIDGTEVPYQESALFSESRIVTIEFKSGDSKIEIIGTYVVPEFGTITMIILMVGILSTVLINKNKFQLRN